MKIIFFGTSEFAVPPLEALVNSRHQVVSVVTQPKKQKGRGLKVLPQAVEEEAQKYDLRVSRFENINSKQAEEFLKEQEAHIFVVVAFGQILSKEVLEMPHFYSMNIHASLLPKYRGAAPIQWAIINGEERTGITIMRMNESLDKGDIITQRELEIGEDEDAASLSRRLSLLGAELLIQTLERIESNDVRFTPQDESKASYAPKLKKENGLIDWKKDAVSIKNLVRGLQPWPSAYTYLDGKLLKILEVSVSAGVKDEVCGSIIQSSEEGISVACGEGAVLVKRLQLEGKRPLTAAEFLRGRPLAKGTIFGK